MKKIIFFGSLMAVFLMIMTPSTPVVQSRLVNNSFQEKIIEIIKNEDFQSLKKLLNQLTYGLEGTSVTSLKLNSLLDKLLKFSDSEEESNFLNGFLKFLLLELGIVCIFMGAFMMYFGSGNSRMQGTLIAIAGIFIVMVSLKMSY